MYWLWQWFILFLKFNFLRGFNRIWFIFRDWALTFTINLNFWHADNLLVNSWERRNSKIIMRFSRGWALTTLDFCQSLCCRLWLYNNPRRHFWWWFNRCYTLFSQFFMNRCLNDLCLIFHFLFQWFSHLFHFISNLLMESVPKIIKNMSINLGILIKFLQFVLLVKLG